MVAQVGPTSSTETVHATTIAKDGRGVLIRGASGSGKSSLALQLIALGAKLVADDRTVLTKQGDRLIASSPARIRGQIEARGIGILAAPSVAAVPVSLLVDLDIPEDKRLPEHRMSRLMNVTLPVIGKSDVPHFPAAILLYLQGERLD